MANMPQFVPLKLPGFGDTLYQDYEIPTAVDDWRAKPITVRERTMIGLMATLKDKPDWQRKVFDEKIVSKWRTEALAFGRTLDAAEARARDGDEADDGDGGHLRNGESIEFDGAQRQKVVSEKMFDYCIAELQEAAESLGDNGMTEVIDTNAIVCMSDTALSHETKENLKAAIAPLENVAESKKDWHPGSDGKVLNLVHPSICPLVYGRSRILAENKVPLLDCHKLTGEGVVIPKPEEEQAYYSENFQWLPCEVKLDNGGKAKITSYINNLHPSGNEELYAAVEDVITQSVPLWMKSVASTMVLPNRDRMEELGDGYVYSEGEIRESDNFHPDTDEYEDIIVPDCIQHGRRKRDQDDLESYYEDYKTHFQKDGLQVIVKLANIQLTPDKPTYDGGSWHIEGQMNEHICASALYYYDEQNITPSYLAFREFVNRDILMEKAGQHREWGYCQIYGINDNWGDAQQVLGKIRTREDRLLVFPNVLQHKVSPFELADRTKPGHRKLLALFLVDPSVKIPSTENVPPQQAEHWTRGGQMDHVFGRFPNEIVDQIMDDVDFPFTNDEAKRIREQLIEERKAFVDEVDEYFAENGYCFCEH